MKYLTAVVVGVLVVGCGANYSITRSSPDGATIRATASVSEEQGSMKFTFDGDPAGAMTITLEKENVVPVNMGADTLRTLLFKPE